MSSKCKNLKTLILDDDIYKTIAIQRALEFCGITAIKTVSNQKSGMKYLYQCMEDGVPVELIVTDMHYPLEAGDEADVEAGFKLVERLKTEGIETPVIICSSINFKASDVLGTVWYNEMRDLNRDFQEILEKLK